MPYLKQAGFGSVALIRTFDLRLGSQSTGVS
ncbi:hypothetical protein Gotur_001573 [Gossypium turneri]